MDTPIMFTVSAHDSIFGQRVNCGSYLTIAEAVAYVNRANSKETRHQIHINPLGLGYIDTPIVWQVLREAR